MSYSATRLTCFALLAALEQDMRDSIELHLGDLPIGEVLSGDRLERAQARRVKDSLRPATDLAPILPYLDFAESYELLAAHTAVLPENLRAAIKALAPAVSRIIAVRNRVAHTRPMEIDDPAVLIDAASSLATDASDWPTLGETLRKLSNDPSFVLGLTIKLPTDPDPAPQHNLPIPDFDETGFFGRQAELRRIKKAINGAYPVVSVLGDGGIGKTSIALKAAYELLDDHPAKFDAFVWVTAKATVLTPTEIRRINGAIESSLGLFAVAAAELGGGAAEDPIAEVLAYMESFRILLILDNLETVLDERLRVFLLDLPLGSKVIVTSRIGLGIENPVQLAPMSNDDSTRLLRALARIRNVSTLATIPQDEIEKLAAKMEGHPAYIRWFVAGVQAGKRPEELIGNNELLLDFCMSNVYEYLGSDATAAVRSMQVLPGGHNQAELAYLNDFTAATTQSTLLELLTTNFVQMSTQSAGQSLDTVYQLSEFAKQYLDKHHPVSQEERAWLVGRSQELVALGFQFNVENSSTPYEPGTVYIRGVGDVHAARLLRDAMSDSGGDTGKALGLCNEAQVLAPAYYESWRVEGYLHALDLNHSAAIAAFDRAFELAPDSAVLAFHYGSYLLNSLGNPARGLEKLQRGARLDPQSSKLAAQIAWAHYTLGDMNAAITSAGQVLNLRQSTSQERRAACVVALRAATAGTVFYLDREDYTRSIETLELAVELTQSVDPLLLRGESFDRLIQLRESARRLSENADGYIERKAAEYERTLNTLQGRVDQNNVKRQTGRLKALPANKRFGFLRYGSDDYFFHYLDLIDRHDWERLAEGAFCAFTPLADGPKGCKAGAVRLLE